MFPARLIWIWDSTPDRGIRP